MQITLFSGMGLVRLMWKLHTLSSIKSAVSTQLPPTAREVGASVFGTRHLPNYTSNQQHPKTMEWCACVSDEVWVSITKCLTQNFPFSLYYKEKKRWQKSTYFVYKVNIHLAFVEVMVKLQIYTSQDLLPPSNCNRHKNSTWDSFQHSCISRLYSFWTNPNF